MQGRQRFFWSILLPLFFGVLGALLVLYVGPFLRSQFGATGEIQIDAADSIFANRSSRPDFEQGFIHAAERASPAVVHVRTQAVVESRSPYHGTIMEFFFGPQPNIRTPVSSTGSGVIIHEQGYIITNNHVVKGAAQIEVRLANRDVYTARLIAADAATDLALLKISPRETLQPLRFGSSDSLRVGHWVLAIGNPFDLETTVTAGIVSAKARSLKFRSERVSIESFIQVDAAVNPGNSGGALVNLQGELVGINTAIASPTGTFAGYAFSIPETIVRSFLEKYLPAASDPLPDLGIRFAPMTQRLADQLAAGNLRGVLITQVEDGSAALQAGLRPGDVLLGVNNRPIASIEEAYAFLAAIDPARKNRLNVLRNGRAIEVIFPPTD